VPLVAFEQGVRGSLLPSHTLRRSREQQPGEAATAASVPPRAQSAPWETPPLPWLAPRGTSPGDTPPRGGMPRRPGQVPRRMGPVAPWVVAADHDPCSWSTEEVTMALALALAMATLPPAHSHPRILG